MWNKFYKKVASWRRKSTLMKIYRGSGLRKEAVTKEWTSFCFNYLKLLSLPMVRKIIFYLICRIYLKLSIKQTPPQRETTIYHSNASDFSGSIWSKHLSCCMCNVLPLTFPMERRELLWDPLEACSNVYGMAVVRV